MGRLKIWSIFLIFLLTNLVETYWVYRGLKIDPISLGERVQTALENLISLSCPFQKFIGNEYRCVCNVLRGFRESYIAVLLVPRDYLERIITVSAR